MTNFLKRHFKEYHCEILEQFSDLWFTPLRLRVILILVSLGEKGPESTQWFHPKLTQGKQFTEIPHGSLQNLTHLIDDLHLEAPNQKRIWGWIWRPRRCDVAEKSTLWTYAGVLSERFGSHWSKWPNRYTWWAFRPRKKIFNPHPPNSLQTPSRPLAPPHPPGRPPPLLRFSIKIVLPLLGASGAPHSPPPSGKK